MSDDLERPVETIDANELIQRAFDQTGLKDFGRDDFEQRLMQLLYKVTDSVHFKDAGLANFRGTLMRHLVNRLRMQEDLKRHPEILEETIASPIIILGMPRTGTTKLQRMISASPDVQRLALWRLFNPAPFPNAAPGRPDPRITAILTGETMLDESGQAEAMNAAHKMGMSEAEEESLLLEYNFDPTVLGFTPYFPLFFHDEWMDGAQERTADHEAYDYVRTILKYLQWQDQSGATERPWILKSPGHTAHLAALADMYPDATFVQSHREPCTVVPSICKYLCSIWEQGFEIDKIAIGEQIQDWLHRGMSRFLTARDQLGLDDRIIDVSYADVRSNPMPAIEQIFAHNGRELTEQARQSMLQWEQINEEGKHGKHVYGLAEFGLSEAKIRSDFAAYYDRFSAYL